jgi:hypothetical protein
MSAAFYIGRNLGAVDASTAQIVIDGTVTAEYDLNANQTIDLKVSEDAFNVIVIENGSCYMKDANCPDRLCVSQGRISKDGESIICLPHRLVIRVVGSEKNDVDAVAR